MGFEMLIFCFWTSGYLMFIKCCEDGDWDMLKIPVKKSLKSWICISYLSKTWNGNLVTFYFQVTESPVPLNIPTPTLAPDHLHKKWISETYRHNQRFLGSVATFRNSENMHIRFGGVCWSEMGWPVTKSISKVRDGMLSNVAKMGTGKWWRSP